MQKLRYSISVYDYIIMYTNLLKAAHIKEIGYENADKTFKQLTRSLKEKRIKISKDDLEDALWACNQLSQRDEFTTADGNKSFKEWLDEAFPGRNFVYYEKNGWVKTDGK